MSLETTFSERSATLGFKERNDLCQRSLDAELEGKPLLDMSNLTNCLTHASDDSSIAIQASEGYVYRAVQCSAVK